MSGNFSKGTWSKGNGWGSVVTNNGEGFPKFKGQGHCDTDHYGGYLIAESIAKDADQNLISAAPDMFEALEKIKKELSTSFNWAVPELLAIIDSALNKANP